MVQLNPVPVFGAKKNTSTIWRKFPYKWLALTDSKSSHELTLLLLQTELGMNFINYRVNFHWLFVFSHYLFRAFYFCLLVAKILALEAIRSVMCSAKIRLWRSPSKPSSSSEVRNMLVQQPRPQGFSLKKWVQTNFFYHIFSVIQPRILFIHHKTRMLSLIWVLNSTAVTAPIQLFFLN